MPSKKFTVELLHSTLERDGASTNLTYDTVSRESLIEYVCKCGVSNQKSFRRIVESGGAFCDSCKEINTKEKIKHTNLEKYGVENPFQNEIIKNKIKETTIANLGVDHPSKSKEIMNKIQRTNLEKYGNICSLQGTEQKIMVKNTFINKFGVKHPLKNKDIINKIQSTNYKRYGGKSPYSDPEIQAKCTQTNLKRYGTKCPLQNLEILSKIKETNIAKYGVDHPTKSEVVKNKIKETCIRKYGVEYPQQSLEIQHKSQCNAKKYKLITMPSGQQRRVQGYEPYALKHLLKQYSEEQIISDRQYIPKIKYSFNEKCKYYFPDIFIPSENKIIEVKSTYTYKIDTQKIKIKADATKEQGYSYEIWVFNTKGEIEFTV